VLPGDQQHQQHGAPQAERLGHLSSDGLPAHPLPDLRTPDNDEEGQSGQYGLERCRPVANALRRPSHGRRLLHQSPPLTQRSQRGRVITRAVWRTGGALSIAYDCWRPERVSRLIDSLVFRGPSALQRAFTIHPIPVRATHRPPTVTVRES
jgi:hypothetical protein